jgi:hypothetical protein
MVNMHRLRITRVAGVVSLAAWLIACSSDQANAPPVFGGEGAVVKDERPLPPASENEVAASAGPCSKPSPAGDRALIDDFEDADNKIFKAFEREGWWYTASDGTEGEKVFPDKGTFEPVALPEAEASKENSFAAHFSAEGMKDWGVTWGPTLKWTRDGIKCPFNASAFQGVTFRAKGPAQVMVKINTPAITPPENDGTCKERCWDAHAKIVRISEGWSEYEVRWDQLQQGGWGTEARFDTARLLALNFAVDPRHMPVDFWVDDLVFIASEPADAPAPPDPQAKTTE